MDSTSPSLLVRLRKRDSPSSAADWARFVGLYSRLIYSWARKRRSLGVSEELVEQALAHLYEKLPEFVYETREGRVCSFRGWLRTVVQNKWIDLARKKRKEQPLDPQDPRWQELAEPDPIEELSREEHERYVHARALEILEAKSDLKSWQICRELVVNRRSAADVASEFGMTKQAVYSAKNRVLNELREELKEFIEE